MRFKLICGVLATTLFVGEGFGLSQAQPRIKTSASGQAGSGAPVDQNAKTPKENAGAPDKSTDVRTDKQKTLAWQADRLVNMANELKIQVDKTNKNILSMKVVEKAQEIETFAKGIKAQAKK